MADKLDPVAAEALDLCNEIEAITKDADPYVALGCVMGVFAGKMAALYGPAAAEKFTTEYTDVISALIVRAQGMQQ